MSVSVKGTSKNLVSQRNFEPSSETRKPSQKPGGVRQRSLAGVEDFWRRLIRLRRTAEGSKLQPKGVFGGALKAFRGVRYNPQAVGRLEDVVAPPYDVIDPALHRELFARNPYNMVRLILGDPTLLAGDPERYRQSAQALRSWRAQGVLIQDERPSFYLTRQIFHDAFGQERVRDGVLAIRRLEPFGPSIRPHEMTLAEPKKDRLEVLKACRANLSPIFCLYTARDDPLGDVFQVVSSSSPSLQIVDEEKVVHQMWVVDQGDLIGRIAEALREQPLLIADGHHRYETALDYQRLMRAPSLKIDEPWDWILVYITNGSSPGFTVEPIHRLVKGLSPSDERRFWDLLKARFHLTKVEGEMGSLVAQIARGPHDLFRCGVVRARGKEMYVASTPYPTTADPAWGRLDTALLQEGILDGLGPQAIDYDHLAWRIAGRLERGEVQVALLMRPPPLSTVWDLAARGIRVPPKTTFFYPKLKTGLVIYAHL